MALIRTFARIDAEGKIELPMNIRVALGLKEQDVVELKTVGPSKSKQVIISKQENRRRYADTTRLLDLLHRRR